MKEVIFIAFLTVLSVLSGYGQTSQPDYEKYEVYGGYSNGQTDTGPTFNGFNVSGVRNIHRYFGFKADFSATYKSQTLSSPTTPILLPVALRTRQSLYNILGGVQVKDNASTSRLKPFGYALVGAARRNIKFRNIICPTSAPCSLPEFSQTGFSMALGGGLDIKITKRIDFRVIKADYNPTRLGGFWEHNGRFGTGIVLKF